MAVTARDGAEFDGDWLTRTSQAGVAVLGCDRDLYAAAGDCAVQARAVSLAEVGDLAPGASLGREWLDRGSRGCGLLVLHGLLPRSRASRRKGTCADTDAAGC